MVRGLGGGGGPAAEGRGQELPHLWDFLVLAPSGPSPQS